MIKWIKEWRAAQKQREHDREWGRGYRAMERVMKRDVQEAAEWFSHAKVATKFEGWNPFDAGVVAAWDNRGAVAQLRETIAKLEPDARRWEWVLRHAYVSGDTVQRINNGRQTGAHVEWIIRFTGGEGRDVIEAIDDATFVGVRL